MSIDSWNVHRQLEVKERISSLLLWQRQINYTSGTYLHQPCVLNLIHTYEILFTVWPVSLLQRPALLALSMVRATHAILQHAQLVLRTIMWPLLMLLDVLPVQMTPLLQGWRVLLILTPVEVKGLHSPSSFLPPPLPSPTCVLIHIKNVSI